MLATFVIGLREGLEAALIVGIIAAFLRRNGASLKPMWIGVTTAVLLAVGVGFGLSAIEASLPQAQQEAMETVIGAVAVIFVTGMIVWMKGNSRGMKRELEREAAAALGGGTAWALGGMAFLAVLKEGFETSVFLLATFQSSTSAAAAAIGAVLGIVVSIGIGWGLYSGGVRLNLSKFFTATGVFLVFVAAGLVMSTLRTAHEAGWLTIGQQPTVDLAWLAPRGSVQAAVLTGVLGIPADPRVIEVVAWLLYLVPVLTYSLWPAKRMPAPSRVPFLQLGGAAVLAVAALTLAVAVPQSIPARLPATAPLAAGGSVTLDRAGDRAVLRLTGADRGSVRLGAGDAVPATGNAERSWAATTTATPPGSPASLDLDAVAALFGGRIPVGIDPARNPGPFAAHWTSRERVRLDAAAGGILDAASNSRTVVTLSGGGLGSPRSLAVPAATGWSVSADRVAAGNAAIAAEASSHAELALWRAWLPLVFAAAAGALALLAWRRVRAAAPKTTISIPGSATYATK